MDQQDFSPLKGLLPVHFYIADSTGPIHSNTANRTAITKGFLSSGGPAKIVATDTTEWVIAHDRNNLRTYIRTDEGLQIQMLDLKKTGFSKPGIQSTRLTRGKAVGE